MRITGLTILRVFVQLIGTELSKENEEPSDFKDGWMLPPKTVAYCATMPSEKFDIAVVDECHRLICGSRSIISVHRSLV